MTHYKLLVPAPLAGALALLAASGSSSTPTPTARPSASPTATASASPTLSSNPAMNLNLTDSEVPSSAAGVLTQAADGLLGGKSNTDQRVFATADRSLVIEA